MSGAQDGEERAATPAPPFDPLLDEVALEHDQHSTAPVEPREHGWLGHGWQSTCMCGWKSEIHNHPIDAGMEAGRHFADETR